VFIWVWICFRDSIILEGGGASSSATTPFAFFFSTYPKQKGPNFCGLPFAAKCCIPLGYSAEGRPIYGRFLFEWPKVAWIYERVSSVRGVLSNTMKETLSA
jgi:hypothetical protein